MEDQVADLVPEALAHELARLEGGPGGIDDELDGRVDGQHRLGEGRGALGVALFRPVGRQFLELPPEAPCLVAHLPVLDAIRLGVTVLRPD